MKTILVTGKDGFFASRFIQYYKDKYRITGLGHRELDITDKEQTNAVVLKYRPDCVVHAAAVSDTGTCERNQDMSYDINVKGSINVAEACSKADAKLIYLSSDQVYNGNIPSGPYSEECIPVPDTVYGRHKIQAEKGIQDMLQDVVILRLTWMFSLPEKNKKTNSNIVWNTVKAAMKNKRINLPANEYRGITYVHDLIKNFDRIFDLPCGIYNAGSENNLSTYEIGKIVLKEMGLDYRISDILIRDTERYKTKSRDLRISNSKLKSLGINFQDTEEAVRSCIKDFSFNIE